MSPKLDSNRVVVTGLGVVSSLGIGWQEYWTNLLMGKSGISKISLFDVSNFNNNFAGEIKELKIDKYLNTKISAFLGRTSKMAVAASRLAINDSQIESKILRKLKTGVLIGTTTGESGSIEKFIKYSVLYNQPNLFYLRHIPGFPSNLLATNVACDLQLRSYNMVFSTACASGNYSIAYAYDLIRTGRLDYALAGGADSLSRIVLSGFCKVMAVAPQKCQPFDLNRKGMIPGEGAGILFLEKLSHAVKRKANIYAEILGCGLSCDALHMTRPDVGGITKAILKALDNASLNINQIDYISAHGTGTRENDKVECQAYESIFGKKIKDIPISSIKSMLGHTMGAASALEAVACCLSINKSRIPPTINFSIPDPECNIDCVPNIYREKDIKIVINNSQAFGGNNACVIIGKI